MKWAPLRPTDPDILRYWKNVEKYWIDEGAYCHQQMTRPQTLSVGMTDSPVGLAAWIVEKWRAWSGWFDDFEKLFPRDMLITNVMLYWVTNSFWSAIRNLQRILLSSLGVTNWCKNKSTNSCCRLPARISPDCSQTG